LELDQSLTAGIHQDPFLRPKDASAAVYVSPVKVAISAER
jgi:hypothetical protein